MEKLITLEDIGEVRLVKSKKARNINISIKPFDGIKVAVPYGISYEEAVRVLRNKKDWIEKHAVNVKDKETNFQTRALNGELKTREHKLVIQRSQNGNDSTQLLEGEILIKLSQRADLRSRKSQEMIMEGLVKAWRKEAIEFLPDRVEILATMYGFHYNNVKVKNMNTRWGSCSQTNNINLSIHLMRLPDHLIDYVIIHELVHTKIKNHGPEFWSRLDEIVGDAKALAREVKEFGVNVF